MPMLNEKEMRVLDILYRDARHSKKEIAKMTGLSEEDVRAAMEKLEEEKIVLKYGALVNWEKTGRDFVRAHIEVRVTPQRDQGFDGIASRIYRYDEVKSVYLMSGAYDLMLVVEAPTLRQLAMFVSEKLSVLEGVTSTATHFTLKVYKREGIIFDKKKEDKRLVISP